MNKVKSPLKHKEEGHENYEKTAHIEAHGGDAVAAGYEEVNEEESEQSDYPLTPDLDSDSEYQKTKEEQKQKAVQKQKSNSIDLKMERFRKSGYDDDGPVYTETQLELIEKRLRNQEDNTSVYVDKDGNPTDEETGRKEGRINPEYMEQNPETFIPRN